jgi:hypothetical protein
VGEVWVVGIDEVGGHASGLGLDRLS